jgi:hypothetical protein
MCSYRSKLARRSARDGSNSLLVVVDVTVSGAGDFVGVWGGCVCLCACGSRHRRGCLCVHGFGKWIRGLVPKQEVIPCSGLEPAVLALQVLQLLTRKRFHGHTMFDQSVPNGAHTERSHCSLQRRVQLRVHEGVVVCVHTVDGVGVVLRQQLGDRVDVAHACAPLRDVCDNVVGRREMTFLERIRNVCAHVAHPVAVDVCARVAL